MSTRGIYNRDGEVFGYMDGDRTYDLNGAQTGIRRGRVVFDMEDNRQWLVDGDALLDLRGNVVGYLGEHVLPDYNYED